MRPFHEQVVVLTGAGSGLGRQLTLDFAKRGARLAIADINDVALAESERLAMREGALVEAVVTDTADWNQVQILSERTLERFGRMDVWINNAAVTVYGEFEQLPKEEFRRVIDVNLMGYAHGLWAAIRAMRETGGHILCITSDVAERAVPLQSAYSASNKAIQGLIETVRVELAHQQRPILMSQIVPAAIDTPFFAHAKSHLGVHPKPTGAVFDPEPVSQAVLRCIAFPQRDVHIGTRTSLLKWSEHLTPGLLDRLLSGPLYQAAKTRQPRPADAPNDLFGQHEPATIRGGFPGHRHSPYTWAMQHPATFWGAVAGLTIGWWLSRRSSA